MWSERKHSSKDAAHATRIVGAILKKVSTHDQAASMQRPPPTPPAHKPEVRGGSLASIMNSEPQNPPMLELFENAGTRVRHSMDFPLDFSDYVPIERMIEDRATVDWVSLLDSLSPSRPPPHNGILTVHRVPSTKFFSSRPAYPQKTRSVPLRVLPNPHDT